MAQSGNKSPYDLLIKLLLIGDSGKKIHPPTIGSMGASGHAAQCRKTLSPRARLPTKPSASCSRSLEAGNVTVVLCNHCEGPWERALSHGEGHLQLIAGWAA